MSNGRLAVPVVVASAFAVLFFGLGSYLGARPSEDAHEQLAALRAEVDQLRRQQLSVADRHLRSDSRRSSANPFRQSRGDRRRRQAAAAERDGTPPAHAASRPPSELRRALLLRRQRREQLRNRRLPRQRLLHHRETRRRGSRAGGRCRPPGHQFDQADVQRQADHRARRRFRGCAGRSRSGRLGDPQGQGSD